MVAPIVIFVYGRANHTKKLIETLSKNSLASESEVFVFSDGYKDETDYEKVMAVRRVLEEIEKDNVFKTFYVYKSERNKGLADSIISGVTDIIDKYGRVIVLEDDLELAPGFLKFMNDALDYYENDQRIWSVSGFTSEIDYLANYPKDVFFSKRARSWSWGTWKDRWDTVDWNVASYRKFKWNFKERRRFNAGGEDMASMLDRQQAGVINSWAIRWCYNQFCQGKFTVQPKISLIRNSGQDGSGTNCDRERESNNISTTHTEYKMSDFEYDKKVDAELAKRKKVAKYKLIGSFIVYVLLGLKIKI